mmetsp:Transcript_17293/g.39861  ORF Transcript_17293/g.39861 Transcript_17293/m.39861 type:complete len:238 (-) Transcript_17293:1720-2433(-)
MGLIFQWCFFFSTARSNRQWTVGPGASRPAWGVESPGLSLRDSALLLYSELYAAQSAVSQRRAASQHRAASPLWEVVVGVPPLFLLEPGDGLVRQALEVGQGDDLLGGLVTARRVELPDDLLGDAHHRAIQLLALLRGFLDEGGDSLLELPDGENVLIQVGHRGRAEGVEHGPRQHPARLQRLAHLGVIIRTQEPPRVGAPGLALEHGADRPPSLAVESVQNRDLGHAHTTGKGDNL